MPDFLEKGYKSGLKISIFPIHEKCENYAEKVLNKLENYDIRGLIDKRNETIRRKNPRCY